jgi:hypothetical protein
MCTDYLIKKYILYCTWSHDKTLRRTVAYTLSTTSMCDSLTNSWRTPDTLVTSDLAVSKYGISKSTLEITQHSFVISI